VAVGAAPDVEGIADAIFGAVGAWGGSPDSGVRRLEQRTIPGVLGGTGKSDGVVRVIVKEGLAKEIPVKE
jgi:hypothetical protein